jgi:hypothetical protein
MRPWRDAPVMETIVEDAERFYASERNRLESEYFKGSRDKARAEKESRERVQEKKRKPSIEERLQAKRVAKIGRGK